MTTADHRPHQGNDPGGAGASAPQRAATAEVGGSEVVASSGAVVAEPSAPGAVEAGPATPDSAPGLLRDLLTREGPYRRRWRSEVRRASARDPHQSAVAMVLAQHLWDTGEVSETDQDLPRRLKDVVARALGGRGISHQTLGWFVGAFAMSEVDERALWQRFEADLRAEVSGAHARPAVPTRVRPAEASIADVTTATSLLSEPRPHASPVGAASRAGSASVSSVLGPAGHDSPIEASPVSAQPHHVTGHTYRTRSLIEQFEIGRDRGRARHSLVHIVQALQPVERISYRFDTAAVTVEVSRGGRATALQPVTGGVHTVGVIFPAALEPGQTTVVQLTATYAPGGRPVTAFRRSLRATAGGVSLELSCDPAALPSAIRWVEWGRSGPDELHTEEIPRGPVAHRFLTPDRDCVVGFEWDW